MLRVYASLLTGLHLPAISDVEFGHMRGGGGGGGPAPALEVPTAEGGTVTVASGAVLAAVGTRNAVRIHFSERSPAARLRGAHEGKLLVGMYAWDGGAYPGNEFYEPCVSSSNLLVSHRCIMRRCVASTR